MSLITDFARLREEMIALQLKRRGIQDPRVLAAMRALPREEFVPEEIRRDAYADRALPIGGGQTISQPYIVAVMLEALKLDGHEHVLEIGTGSAYQTVLLAQLAREVDSIEIVSRLVDKAQETLKHFGLRNVALHLADGSRGLPDKAPFDAITVTAAAPDVPKPFLDQLVPGGRLVIPIGGRDSQELVLIQKKDDGTCDRSIVCRCQFVPLLGQYGFPA